MDKVKCPKCHKSDTHKYGFRMMWNHGKKYRVQAYQCNECGHQWREKT